MSGQWPPDWGDPDDVAAETEQPDAEADARLSEVSAYLAALPRPALPDAVAARISAAIAAEASARTQRTAAAEGEGAATGGRTLGSPPRRPKVRRSRKFRVRAISSVAGCLVLALFGYLLTLTGGSSSSSSAPSVAAGSAAPAASAAQSAAGASRAGASAAEPLPAAASRPSGSQSAPFRVTVRGDAYDKSTLVSLVRERLSASQQDHSFAAGVGSSPSAALVGCVLHLTGNMLPRLVDEATYAGEPVYVIAVSDRAWVVGRGCTAAHPELITSVSLAGISAP